MQQTWSTVPKALASFKEILSKQCPKPLLFDLRYKLSRSLENNSFRNEMVECGALLNWDAENNFFDPPWTQPTIEAAVNAIEDYYAKLSDVNNNANAVAEDKILVKVQSYPVKKINPDEMAPSPVAILRLKFLENKSEESAANQRQTSKPPYRKFQFLDPTENSSNIYQRVAPKLLIETGYQMEEENTSGSIKTEMELKKPTNSFGEKLAVSLKWEWQSLAGESLEFTDPLNFIKISDIIEQPAFTNKDTQLLRQLLPFILQKIKMWDCKILTPDYLSQLLPISEEEPSWKDDDMDDYNEQDEQLDKSSGNSMQVLSKLDVLTLIVSSTDITVLSDIFQNISKFPIALPIILPNPIPNKNGKMLMVTPALEKCLIRWEQKGKGNGENYLFKNSFKLITAIRIGNAESLGKSSFLNQIFLQSNIFQCKGQPGNGKPVGLNGSAEFIWLTKDTCKEIIWSTIQTELEESADNEIVLLGNVHGDALQNEETLMAMNSITSKYIVFVMPNEVTNENKEQLAKLVGKENILFIYVDPRTPVDNLKTLRTHLITDSNATLTKLKQYIKQALKSGRKVIMSEENPNSTAIAHLPTVYTKESKHFMKLVHRLNDSVSYVRDLLCLQKIKKAEVDQYWRTYTDSPHLIQLIENFTKILLAPLSQRRSGLTHVEQELSILSSKKLAGFSTKLVALLEKRNRLVDTDPHWEETNEEIAKINKEFENSLSLNDFLRELSIAYEIVFIHGLPEAISLISKLPALYAELLIEGRTLEILDGDAGSVPGLWLESVCHEVCHKLGNLKVFVVSILGLQSSGKSTLLNALFGCKFATSVGKCTKGLFMRLMLLEESFKKQLGLDAILVVDTEGLGSPESMLDPNSESKDRTMATFAMTISNLTLINVAGESNKEMVDILQIVILTMARMEKTDLSPDLLLVQQVPEGGHEALLAKGVDNFCKALEEAVRVIKSQEIDLGVRTLTNLKTLQLRLRQREILYQLRPFKSGASPQSPPSEEYCQDVLGLRNRIIKEYSTKKHFIDFCAWHKLLKGYWQTVQKENFALRFTSMRQVQEFIEVNTRIAVVKNDLDMVFQHHRSSVDTYINEKLNLLNKETVTSKFEREIQEQINSKIDQLPGHCQPGSVLCKWCIQAEISRKNLLEFVKQTSSVSVNDTETNIKACVEDMRKTSKTQILRRFESLKIKHGKASEFDTILNSIIQDLKATNKNQSVSVEDIWTELLSTVQHKYPIGFNKDKVFIDITNAYSHIPDVMKWKSELEKIHYSDTESKPTLATEKAKKNKKRLKLSKPNLNLTPNEHNWLCGKLKEISENIVANRRQERVGYAETLVLDHKKKVPDMLQKFEERFKTSLKNQFKHDAMFYSLQMFVQHIFQLQAEWNRQNEPYCVLLKQKQEYVQKISMYLAIESPIQVNSYGISTAKQLLEAAQSVCISSMQVTNYFEKWATHSEGIRLRYLISLAEELKRGDEKVVLGHFQDPQRMLTEWYIQTIEYAMHNIVVPMLKETFVDEITAIGNQIVSTKSMKEFVAFVNWYLGKVGENLILEKVTDDLHEKLKAEIQKQMSKFVKEYTEQIRVENLPVNEEVFLSILGCTATCPGCGAICWGTKNHENGLARYKRHFTCHQPKGLAGVIDEISGTLDFKSCCHYEDDESQSENNGNLDSADNIPTDDVQWLNESHPVEEYNQLMDWFFLKLKGKLSGKFGSKLPKNDAKETARLAYLTYLDKHLDRILNLIKHKSLL